MIEIIGSIPVFVEDQGRALEFYQERLGFQVALDIPIGHGVRWLTVCPPKGGTDIILFPPAMAGGDADEMRSRIGVWTGIVITSDNCRQDHADLVERGVRFKSPPERTPWGGWMAEFFDADENRFQLVERPAYMR